jgi:8-oxo-dGTP diphosphatase
MERPTVILPVFGVIDPSATYLPRRAAYGVFRRGESFAAVRAAGGSFLPGGGCEGTESFEETLRREVRQELGCQLADAVQIGTAIQYFHASSEAVDFKMEAAFFSANLCGDVDGQPEYELEWLPLVGSQSLLFHASHWWAVQQVFGGIAHAV